MNKKTLITLLFVGFSIASPVLANNDQTLLKAFHKYGIKKCDSFILENSALKSNWNLFINKHSGGIDGPATEVTATQIFGKKGDTVKIEDTYIQTAKKCFLKSNSTLTFPGPCSDSINGSYWYVSTKMPHKDYTGYKNANGVEMLAKEISVGNFKVCIQESFIRKSGSHG